MATKTLADESIVPNKGGDGGSIIVTSLLQMAALAKIPGAHHASSSERGGEDVRSSRGGGSRCSSRSIASGGRSRRDEMPSEENVRVLLSDANEYKVLQIEMERSGFITNVGLQHVVVDFINRRTKEKRKAQLEARRAQRLARAMDDDKLPPLSSFLGFLYADSRGGKGLSKELLLDKLTSDTCSLGSSSLSSSKIPSSLRWDTAAAFFDPSSLLKDKDIRRQSFGAPALSSGARRRMSRLGEEALPAGNTDEEVGDSTYMADGRRDVECRIPRPQSPPLAMDASGRHSCRSPSRGTWSRLEEEDTKRSEKKGSTDKTVEDSETESEEEDEDDTETWLAWPVLISDDDDDDVGDAASDTVNVDRKDSDGKKQKTQSSKKMRWLDRLTCVDEIIDMPQHRQQRSQQQGSLRSSSSNSASLRQEKASQEPNEQLYNILREVSHLEAKSEPLSRKTL